MVTCSPMDMAGGRQDQGRGDTGLDPRDPRELQAGARGHSPLADMQRHVLGIEIFNHGTRGLVHELLCQPQAPVRAFHCLGVERMVRYPPVPTPVPENPGIGASSPSQTSELGNLGIQAPTPPSPHSPPRETRHPGSQPPVLNSKPPPTPREPRCLGFQPPQTCKLGISGIRVPDPFSRPTLSQRTLSSRLPALSCSFPPNRLQRT